MSTVLFFRPTPAVLPYELKNVISKRFWGTDGSCGGGIVVASDVDLEYLYGVRDAGVSGAQTLIDAISEHGKVSIWHQG